ncbi:hypothetical protein I3842_Q104200 [Carya illinoinensis]|uniref:Uncharacterized protein n=1 Tax=Carya illinoinensis TaxID=32201 RepID=A0A921ZXY7_CARIL|nr:hypothetical protein I3842_Q104200 [Carya illinoinensis]
MKLILRCQRILILSLLAVSVFAPIVFFSQRLKNLSHIGREEFVQDLSNIKYKTDAALRLNAVEQESGEDLTEPKQVVYEDRNLGSGVSYSSIENHDSQESENAGDSIKFSERNETNLERKEGQKSQQSELSSTNGEEEHSSQTAIEHEKMHTLSTSK